MDAGTSNLSLIVEIRNRRDQVAVLRDDQIVSHSVVSLARSPMAEALTEQLLHPIRVTAKLVRTLVDTQLRLVSELALPVGIEGALERATGLSVFRETR